MNEKAIRIYDAVTLVREEYVEAAAKPCPRRPVVYVRRGVGALAACFVLAFATVLALMALGVGVRPIGPANAGGGGGGGTGGVYQAYVGPILPLTAREAEETLAVSRRTTLDFTPYKDAPIAPLCDEFLYVANTFEYLDCGGNIFSVGIRYYFDVLVGILLSRHYNEIENFYCVFEDNIGHAGDSNRLW